VHVERVLPVAKLEGLQALAVQHAGSALLDTKEGFECRLFNFIKLEVGFPF
jgi:hypothetical protein